LAPAATVGWAFTTPSTPVTVTALDAILNNGVTATTVRIYNGSGTILATTTVSTSDPTETAGLTWFSHAISPVTLPTNTTLYIAEDAPTGLFYSVGTSTPVMSNGLGYGAPGGAVIVRGVSTSVTGGTPTTDFLGSNVLNPSYFGPNFDLGTAVVPEPSTLISGGTAVLVGLVIAWRRHRARATA
jgi:hypothetical protein